MDAIRQIDKKRGYSLAELSMLLEIPVPTLRTWRDLGMFNPEKTEAHRLKTRSDGGTILGRDLLFFLQQVDSLPLETMIDDYKPLRRA